jgi:Uma2 family endonuclease
MVAPYDITLKRHPEDINIVQPDIMVICDLDEKLNQQDYYMGTPALVVEIISESTKRKDLIKKLDLYMSCGIQEYWIVNPSNRQVSIYLFKDQNIREYTAFKYGETAESFTFKGLTVNLSQIFR